MIVYIISLLLSVVLYFYAPKSMDVSYMSVCLIISLLEITFFLFYIDKGNSEKFKKIYLRHSIIFIFCFSIVFFQCDLDYVLGLGDPNDYRLWYTGTAVCKALALSIMAMSSFLVGCSIIARKELIMNPKLKQTKYDTSMKSILCIIGFVVLGVYLVFVPREYLLGGYNEGIDRGSANVLLILLQAVFIATFVMYSYEYKEKHEKNGSFFKELRYPIILAFFYIGIVLITGRRTEAIRIALLLVIVYVYSRGRYINYKLMLLYGLAALLIFSVTSLLRSYKTSSFSEGVSIMAESSSISPFTQEYANSVNTLHVAVENFPDKYEYNKGITFFPAFSVLIPGLDRLISSSIGANIMGIRSENVITNLGLAAGEEWGMGTSAVADVYISFGPPGVIVVFILLGMFLKLLEIGTFRKYANPFFLVLSFGCFSQIMYVCRGAIGNMFLSWSYATILLFIFIRKRNVKSL